MQQIRYLLPVLVALAVLAAWLKAKESVPPYFHYSRAYRFKNGYGIDIATGVGSLGVEAALFKWKAHLNTRWENFSDWLRAKLGKFFVIEPAEERWEGQLILKKIFDNPLFDHPKFEGTVFANLTPEERTEIRKLAEALEPWKEWHDNEKNEE